MKRALLLSAGYLSLSLGIAGVFVPLLPTTPFLLLSTSLFMKSSPRLYRWLVGHPLLGTHILCYRKYRAISLRSKIFTFTLLWGVIGSTVLFLISFLWLRLLLLAIAVGVTVHVGGLKNLTEQMVRECRIEDQEEAAD